MWVYPPAWIQEWVQGSSNSSESNVGGLTFPPVIYLHCALFSDMLCVLNMIWSWECATVSLWETSIDIRIVGMGVTWFWDRTLRGSFSSKLGFKRTILCPFIPQTPRDRALLTWKAMGSELPHLLRYFSLLRENYFRGTDSHMKIYLGRREIFGLARCWVLHSKFALEPFLSCRQVYQKMRNPSIYFGRFFPWRSMVRNMSKASYAEYAPRRFEICLENL